jgi:hypothetical protein
MGLQNDKSAPAAQLKACPIIKGKATPQEEAVKILQVEKRANDRMMAEFEDAHKSLKKADCYLPGTTLVTNCETLNNAITDVEQEFFRAIKSATLKNAANFEKYMTSCTNPDSNEIANYKSIRQDLYTIFLLVASRTTTKLDYADARNLIDGPLHPDAKKPFEDLKPQDRGKRTGISPKDRFMAIDQIIAATPNPEATIKAIDAVLVNLQSDNDWQPGNLPKK